MDPHATTRAHPDFTTLSSAAAPPPFDRFEILRLAEAAGREGGWTGPLLAHLELLLCHSRRRDWEPEERPVVWLSVRATAEKLGVSRGTVRRHERVLEGMGVLVVRTRRDRRRGGRRGEDGYIQWAYGVDLSPARDHLPELREAAAAARRRGDALELAHAQARDLHEEARGILDAGGGGGDAAGGLRTELAAMQERFRRSRRIERVREWIEALLRLLDRLRRLAGLAETAPAAPAAGGGVENPVAPGAGSGTSRRPEWTAAAAGMEHANKLLTHSEQGFPCNGLLGENLPGPRKRAARPAGPGRGGQAPAAGPAPRGGFRPRRRPAAGAIRAAGARPPAMAGRRAAAPVRLPAMDMIEAAAGKVPYRAAREIADELERRSYWIGYPADGWAGLADGARSQMLRLGVSQAEWGDACRVMGRGAAVCAALLVLLKWDLGVVFSPVRYFGALVDRAGRGEFRLAASVYGWLVERRRGFPGAAGFSRGGGLAGAAAAGRGEA